MNELIYSFLNEIEDVNKIKEMTVEEFSKLVKSNKLISDDDAKQLIESFKKISEKKIANSEESDDADQRKKKYREQHKNISNIPKIEQKDNYEPKEKDGESLER
ncbi:MAG: hypothetical protein IJE68_04090 [Clostridia bacterium]|nr:hypothetical protein [Clostridia bacterium]